MALADVILVVHFLFVVFVVGTLPAIWIGALAHWQWVRGLPLRLAHLGAIGFVAISSLAGVPCPLTVWEDALRGAASGQGFIERWVHRAMFFDWPTGVFTGIYVAFAAAVAITFRLVPPHRSRSAQ